MSDGGNLIPRRSELSPATLVARAEDAAAWRTFVAGLRKVATRGGFKVSTSFNKGGPASWWGVRVLLTREGAPCPTVEMISASGQVDDDAGCLLRQYDTTSGFSGPNHGRRMRTDVDVVALARLLTLRPFDRDRCAHCGADMTAPPDVAARRLDGSVR